jgi:hypothetical protein
VPVVRVLDDVIEQQRRHGAIEERIEEEGAERLDVAALVVVESLEPERALWDAEDPVLTLRGCIRGSVRREDLDARHGLVAAT